MDEKKLLIILGSMGRGGAERVISLISDYVCKKGWKVYIVLLLFNKVDYEVNNNVSIINLTGNTNSRIKRLPGWIVGIRRILREIKPDCLLSFAARINIISLLSCIGLKQKIVISERNDPYMDGRTKIIDFMTKILYPKADAIVFQTKRAQSYFENVKFKRIYRIPNPIFVSKKAENMNLNKIVSVGRLTEQKNHKMLIDAFYDLHFDLPEVKLYIYGEGELKDELLQYVEKLNIERFVIFKGNVNNVHEQIADAAVFVLSSTYEGLSNALLEAMSMGLPCISTNCAGADEYIINYENGLLVPINNKNQLYKAMKKMLNDRQLREKCKKEALLIEKKVSAEVVLKDWYDVLN